MRAARGASRVTRSPSSAKVALLALALDGDPVGEAVGGASDDRADVHGVSLAAVARRCGWLASGGLLRPGTYVASRIRTPSGQHRDRVEVELEPRRPLHHSVRDVDEQPTSAVGRTAGAACAREQRPRRVSSSISSTWSAQSSGGHRQQPEDRVVDDLGEHTAEAEREHRPERRRRHADQDLHPAAHHLLDQDATAERDQPLVRLRGLVPS